MNDSTQRLAVCEREMAREDTDKGEERYEGCISESGSDKVGEWNRVRSRALRHHPKLPLYTNAQPGRGSSKQQALPANCATFLPTKCHTLNTSRSSIHPSIDPLIRPTLMDGSAEVTADTRHIIAVVGGDDDASHLSCTGVGERPEEPNFPNFFSICGEILRGLEFRSRRGPGMPNIC